MRSVRASAFAAAIAFTSPNGAAQEVLGIENFPGDADARAVLDRQGFVVLPDARLPGAEGPMKQTFEVHLGANTDTIVTADVVIDAVNALSGRVLTEVEFVLVGLAEGITAELEAVVEALPLAESRVTRELVACSRELAGEPDVAAEVVLARHRGVEALLPVEAARLLEPTRRYQGSRERAAYFRRIRLLQLACYAPDDPERAALLDALRGAAGARFRDAVNRWIAVVRQLGGPPSAEGWIGAVPLTDPATALPLLPTFQLPLGAMWRRAEYPATAIDAIAAYFAKPNDSDVGGHAWQLAEALRELERPAAGSASVFGSEAWRTLHANTRAAALAQTQEQSGLYASIRLRGIATSDVACVVPFPGLFERLADCVQTLTTRLRAVAPDRVPLHDDSLRGDLANGSTLCKSLASIARSQIAGETLTEGAIRRLDDVGVVLAQMHGYHSDAWEMPRDDHARSCELGTTRRDDTTLLVGVARPELLFVIVPRRGRPVLHVGAVLSYREHAVRHDEAVQALASPWSDDAVPRAFRTLRVTNRR